MLVKETHFTIIYYCDICKSKIKYLVEHSKPKKCAICHKEICDVCTRYLFSTVICNCCYAAFYKDFKELININKTR